MKNEKLNLTLSGDFFNNNFTMYSVNLSFDNLSFGIFLTAEQTQMAIDYDDAFEPVLELKNALCDAGIGYIQKIEIDQDDDGAEEFLKDYNNINEEPWSNVNTLTLTDTNSVAPQGGNILIESNSGHIFEISTETYEENTSLLINRLSELFQKTGIKTRLN